MEATHLVEEVGRSTVLSPICQKGTSFLHSYHTKFIRGKHRSLGGFLWGCWAGGICRK